MPPFRGGGPQPAGETLLRARGVTGFSRTVQAGPEPALNRGEDMRPVPAPPEIVGRYALHGAMASGGMAVVHFGKQLGALGFSRPVAIKRVLPQLARDQAVRDMFIDEARLASRVRHPNVVPTLDVVPYGDELLLVMEYVHGESLQVLLRAARARGERVPLRIALAIASAMLHGLHAAHEATSETGEPLGIVHRDVSPQNVIVGVDGVPRVLDFGIARAAVRVESTARGDREGQARLHGARAARRRGASTVAPTSTRRRSCSGRCSPGGASS